MLFSLQYSNMFSDIYSVRSLPISSGRRIANKPIPVPSIYSPSEQSPSRVALKQSNDWRNNLHPQIDEQYNRIMRGEGPYRARDEKNIVESTRKTESSGGQRFHKEYQQKIKALEEQNHNLRQQLYYLRQALLINFSQRQSK